eukprot:TRINITY_DN520_c0_g1_i2.p2 TRINITY_DN520_c0_g1~~TRINITY_DN520_c0_g1_i2.p2  ORF type:complete len:107 (-),score=5.56 TRINITY_DN520_c0_g1_i2:122-442(-)
MKESHPGSDIDSDGEEGSMRKSNIGGMENIEQASKRHVIDDESKRTSGNSAKTNQIAMSQRSHGFDFGPEFSGGTRIKAEVFLYHFNGNFGISPSSFIYSAHGALA